MNFKISNFVLIGFVLLRLLESRLLTKEAEMETLESFTNKGRSTPSKETVENTIQETSSLLSGLRGYDEVNHHICLELKYLNFSSIKVSSKCIMLYEKPGCQGKVNEDNNSAISIGKNKLSSCKENSVVASTGIIKERRNDSIIVSPTGSTIFSSPQIDELGNGSTPNPPSGNGDSSYDLSDFPDEGEFEPWKPTVQASGLPIITTTELSRRRAESATVLIVNDPNTPGGQAEVTINVQSKIPTSHQSELRDSYPRGPEQEAAPCKRKCEAIDTYGIHWEVCLSGTGFRPCPGDTHGSVVWQCGSSGHFIQRYPDYSQCHSKWVSDAESSIILVKPTHRAEDNFREMTGILLQKVNKSSIHVRPQYFGHEIPGILTLVDRVKEGMDKKDLDDAESLVSSSVVILDNVASEPETWNQLPQRQRATTGTQLIRTIESTMFGLAKAGRKFGKRKYDKSFARSSHLRVRVGSFKRVSPGEDDQILGQEPNDPTIKLPPGWTASVPEDATDDEVHFVQMSMTPDCVKNIIPPSSKWGDSERKILNSKLATFSVSDHTGLAAAKINFTGDGIRITFPHDAEAWGNKGSTEVRRRLHSDEKSTVVMGSAVCVYWDTDTLDWSSEGCQLVESGRMSSTCECKHLTSFAVLMDAHQYIGKDVGILVLTRLLCTLSCIFLLATIIIFKRLHSVRNPRSSVTIHLCFCLLLGNILILTLMDRDNFPLPSGLCAFVGMATHFVFLSAFAWMGIEGFIVYKMVVDVFDSGTENKIKLRLVAYGVPLVIVLIFLVIHVTTDGSTYGGELYCWLQGNYIWSFIVPVICVCLMNFVVLVIALQTAFNKKNSTIQVKQTAKQSRTMIIGTLSLTCLLGLTWIFGLLLTIDAQTVAVVGAYLFTILNASQGIFIFIFHCWMNKQVRNALTRRVTAWHSTFVSTDNTKMGDAKDRRRSEPSFIHPDDPSSPTNTTMSTSITNSNAEEKAVILPPPSKRESTAYNLPSDEESGTNILLPATETAF